MRFKWDALVSKRLGADAVFFSQSLDVLGQIEMKFEHFIKSRTSEFYNIRMMETNDIKFCLIFFGSFFSNFSSRAESSRVSSDNNSRLLLISDLSSLLFIFRIRVSLISSF